MRPFFGGPQGPGTRALSCEFERSRYRRRAAFLTIRRGRRSMGRIPINRWSGSVGLVLKALEMCRINCCILDFAELV